MAAHKDNVYAQKLTDTELRQEAYKSFCKHISDGYCQESWYYDHPDLRCTYKTMLRYIRENPDEFPPDEKEIAISRSHKGWEGILYDSAKGKNTKCNIAALQMLMRNKFGWDKRDPVVNVDNVEITLTHDKLMSQIEQAQAKVIEAQAVKIEDKSLNSQQ